MDNTLKIYLDKVRIKSKDIPLEIRMEIISEIDKYAHLWDLMKKDSTNHIRSQLALNAINAAHREIFGEFANLNCNNCINEMIYMVMSWFDVNKSIHYVGIKQDKEQTLEELKKQVKDKGIKLPHNPTKEKLRKILKDNE